MIILRQLKDEIGLIPVNDIRTGTAISVSSAILTTILTLSALTKHKIMRISCSGQDYAKYELFIDTVLIETKRSGQKRNVDFNFTSGLLLNNTQVLDVKVTHFFTGDSLDFESTIYSII